MARNRVLIHPSNLKAAEEGDGVTLGQRIRNARFALGMSQMELASRAGVSHDTVQAWEAGDYMPSWVRMRKVAEALQTPFMDLVQDEKLG